jgi:hypothetical protein
LDSNPWPSSIRCKSCAASYFGFLSGLSIESFANIWGFFTVIPASPSATDRLSEACSRCWRWGVRLSRLRLLERRRMGRFEGLGVSCEWIGFGRIGLD